MQTQPCSRPQPFHREPKSRRQTPFRNFSQVIQLLRSWTVYTKTMIYLKSLMLKKYMVFIAHRPQLTIDLLSNISDPEHPLTLSQLAVVQLPHITVNDDPSSPMSSVLVEITPTIPHCSMATLIGLCIRVRLERALPQRFRVDIRVRPGTHQSENQV